jgi:hypothetical protein
MTLNNEDIQGTVDAAIEAFGDDASKQIAAKMLHLRSTDGRKFWFAVWKRLQTGETR